MALTLFVYAPVRQFDFVSLDDPAYITQNQNLTGGLTWSAVTWAFTTGYAANWHPLTWLSHMVDVQMFGIHAGPQHVTSAVLHLANVLLLFFVLHCMTGRKGRSAFVAALFAIHPLHVESVAWLSERKDVLSTLFWMLTLWAYVRYVGNPRWNRYGLLLSCFALGLMAKPMLVTMPFVLLLLDVWPLGRSPLAAPAAGETSSAARRQTWTSLVQEKIPLLALAAASSLITFIVQRQGGAVSGLGIMPLERRILNALVAYVAYIGKMIWPRVLIPFYPYPESIPLWSVAGALIVLVAASVLSLRQASRRPYISVGWFWYLGTMFPVIGAVQVGLQAMADRYTYVPLIGLFIIAAWGVPDLLARRQPQRMIPIVASVVVVAFLIAARAQVAHWKTSSALWQHALDRMPDNYYAHDALGLLLIEQGRAKEALVHFSESVRLAPWYADSHAHLGLALARQGRIDEAIPQYRKALQLNPRLAEAHNNLGTALMAGKHSEEAAVQFAEALRLNPELSAAHDNLGKILANQGKLAEAIAHYTEALRLQPDLASAHLNLGLALEGVGKRSEAAGEFAAAVRLDPSSVEAHSNLGVALAAQGKSEEALAQCVEAMRLDPNRADVRNNLAGVLAAQGKASEAVAQYVESLRLNPDQASVHTGLAILLAARGNTAEALPHFREAVRLEPESETAHLYLGLALASTGRFDEAVSHFAIVLRINPNNEKARQALERLKKRY